MRLQIKYTDACGGTFAETFKGNFDVPYLFVFALFSETHMRIPIKQIIAGSTKLGEMHNWSFWNILILWRCVSAVNAVLKDALFYQNSFFIRCHDKMFCIPLSCVSTVVVIIKACVLWRIRNKVSKCRTSSFVCTTVSMRRKIVNIIDSYYAAVLAVTKN